MIRPLTFCLAVFFLGGCDRPEPSSPPADAPVEKPRQVVQAEVIIEPKIEIADAATKTEKTIGQIFLREKYNELLSFKSSQNFAKFGFAEGGPYKKWLMEVELRRDSPDFSLMERVAIGDLLGLALEYSSNRGKETEYSRFAKSKIEERIDQ